MNSTPKHDLNLKNCPQCGSQATIDSHGTVECYGRAWQSITVECSNVNGDYCGMWLTLHCDVDEIEESWAKVTDMWNSLNRKSI